MSKDMKSIKSTLENDGFVAFKGFFDKAQCEQLKKDIKAKRPDGSYRFYKTEEDFIKNGRFEKTNPGLDFSLINEFDTRSIDEKLFGLVRGIFQSDFTMGNKKIIRNIPIGTLPDWLKKYASFINHNVNPYLLDEYQDEGLNYGADIHQDHMGDDTNWFTAYIYLDEVGSHNAPLNFFKGSHKLGQSNFPQTLREIDSKIVYYNDRGSMFTEKIPIFGSPGDLVLFSAYTLHSTVVNGSQEERAAIRYLFKIHDFSYEDMFDKNPSHLTFHKDRDFQHFFGKNPI